MGALLSGPSIIAGYVSIVLKPVLHMFVGLAMGGHRVLLSDGQVDDESSGLHLRDWVFIVLVVDSLAFNGREPNSGGTPWVWLLRRVSVVSADGLEPRIGLEPQGLRRVRFKGSDSPHLQ